MPGPLLSVLLPVRNGARTLPAALASLRGQAFTDFEVLVLDDGSTDGSGALAAAFGDPRIRVLADGVQRGLAARLNAGVREARGSLVARMDADDVCFPERFARQVRFLQQHPDIDLVGCRAVVFRDADAGVIGLLQPPASHEALTQRPWNNIPLPHPTWMGRRPWFERHAYRAPEVRRAEDQELLLRAMPTSRYACLPEVLLGYRQGPFQLRRTFQARRSLLAAQAGLFARRHQWTWLALACAVTLAKLAVDLVAALPGAQRAYFVRMRGEVPPDVERQLRASLPAAWGGSP
jgi:glycosyltransferase involved in cell wall biosynthesis